MCRIRGYRHGCDHIEYRFMSICRGTFSTKYSPHIPLCLSRESSEILISVDGQCSSCGFRAFKQGWEDRIVETEKKRDSVQAQLFEFEGQGSNWWATPNPPVGIWEYDDDFSDFWYDFDARTDSSFDGCDEKEKEPVYSEEEACLRAELVTAQAEVDKVRQQYGQDIWQQWKGYFGTSKTASKRPSHWKRRLVSPKIHCGSPLKHVTNVAKETEYESDDTCGQLIVHVASGDSSTDEESECSDSPAPSMYSSFSEDCFNGNTTGNVAKTMNASSKELDDAEMMSSTTTFSFPGHSAHSATLRQTEDSDLDMLPNWVECRPANN